MISPTEVATPPSDFAPEVLRDRTPTRDQILAECDRLEDRIHQLKLELITAGAEPNYGG